MRRLCWFAVVARPWWRRRFVAGTEVRDARSGRSRRRPTASGSPGPTDRRCWSGPCQTLWIGAQPRQRHQGRDARGPEHCDEIVWTRDGSRVAFLIDGDQLRFYDPRRARAGRDRSRSCSRRPVRTTSIARGMTFSDNGRAITFDECPRGRSGCRAGFAAVPR